MSPVLGCFGNIFYHSNGSTTHCEAETHKMKHSEKTDGFLDFISFLIFLLNWESNTHKSFCMNVKPYQSAREWVTLRTKIDLLSPDLKV